MSTFEKRIDDLKVTIDEGWPRVTSIYLIPEEGPEVRKLSMPMRAAKDLVYMLQALIAEAEAEDRR